MKRFIAILAVLVGFNVLIYAANTCTNTDQACYVTGAYTNPTTVFRVDSAGNTTTNGTLTVTGATTHTGATTQTGTLTINGNVVSAVQQAVQLSSFSTITPTSKFIIVSSSGNIINMAGAGTANLPVISTASATAGQEIVLISTSPGGSGVGQVTVSSGTSAGLDLGSATRALTYGKALGLYFNSINSTWVEEFYGNN